MYFYLLSRRKNSILGEEPTNINLRTNVDSVRHLSIHNASKMKQFGGQFINATELTLCEQFEVLRDSLVIDLNRVIPLKQLTQLTFECHRLSFKQLIELLHSTPTIQTLNFDSVFLYRMDSVSIQQS